MVTERRFGTLKSEWLRLQGCETPRGLRDAVARLIDIYDTGGFTGRRAGELRRGLRGLGKRGVPAGQDEARDGHRGRLDRRQARPGRRACAPRAVHGRKGGDDRGAPGRQDPGVADNLSAHRAEGVRDAVEARGAKVVYLPPYSPGLSPIEKMRSKATPSDCEGVVQVVRLLGGGD